ncbi:alpha-1,3-mannosyl-glycoprotein 2-beta-N-acetylglucosaminyltransferase [Skeletonema marinoi]|uniref:alpha-1,3-mannosyl-glycoprotein 2-beta-N-acetylglucosaminyltransferase n=1 Tax=Skeletonema marinoi TaxID=267567 RepID=A0AAD8YE45_9STRA|nr:alpha-1,3-mannosyl-glycoprotein 2-beta-N-acetylglucosaminyltransferase [Skeletonema marinoi]
MLDVNQMESPVLVFTFKRADYFERAMWKLYENHPAQKYVQQKANLQERHDIGRTIGAPIIISQDGDDPDVKAVIEAYREAFEINLDKQEEVQIDSWDIDPKPYQDLARHYGWALEQTFSARSTHLKTTTSAESSILEEDIEIATDFFSLMNATADMLDSDDTLLAVSGYNDNGKTQHVADSKRLVRSDFFPGLGWMMPRRVWDGVESHPNTALKNNWAPNGFGMTGYHDLNQILLDRVGVQWEKEDLSYLKPECDVRLVYNSLSHFETLAFNFDIMADEKAGIAWTNVDKTTLLQSFGLSIPSEEDWQMNW